MAVSRANLTVALVVGAIALAVDQVSKYYVTDLLGLPLGRSMPVIEGILTFVHTQNFGINFGWLQMPPDDPRPRYALIGIKVVVSLLLLIWAARRWRDPAFSTGIGLVVGGALGNAYDRMSVGAVTDFLNVTCCGIGNPFAFNIADVAIFAGIAMLLFQTRGDDKRVTQDETEAL